MSEVKDNKRKFTRVLFNTKAVVESGSVTLIGEVANLCLNGMFFNAPHTETIRDRQKVVVAIMIEGQSSVLTVRIRGWVLRHQDKGVAIKFDARRVALDSLMLLKTIIMNNGGDREKIDEEFRFILRSEEDRVRGIRPRPTTSRP